MKFPCSSLLKLSLCVLTIERNDANDEQPKNELELFSYENEQFQLQQISFSFSLTPTYTTKGPTQLPTEGPTQFPTEGPTQFPTEGPTQFLTEDPTQFLTEDPTQFPTTSPTPEPINIASTRPSNVPSRTPTLVPTRSLSPSPFACAELQTQDSTEYVERVKDIYETVSGDTAFNGNDADRLDALNFILDTQFCADPPRMIQRYISALFYFATEGENWQDSVTWLSGEHECEWDGITCGDDLIITEINRDDNGLSGTVPFEVCDLPLLRVVDLDSNEIGGTIPTELGDCQNLEIFDMDNNELSGSLPDGLFSIPNLRALDLDTNELTGTISSDFGNLVNLEFLALDTNKFEGTIPASISALQSLTNAYFDGNDLTGTMPDLICQNRNDVGTNNVLDQLTADCKGPNPKLTCLNNCCSMCFDSNSDNEIFTMAVNISGELAVTTQGTPQNLAYNWILQDAERRGNSDFSICGLPQRYATSVLYFSLGGDQWTNTANFLSEDSECDWNASFDGDNRKGLTCVNTTDGRCVEEIMLGANSLIGFFPQEITNLPYLKIIDMDKNEIFGTLPKNIGTKLQLLRDFDLDENQLTGMIPKSLYVLKGIEVIDLDTNSLTGNILGVGLATSLKHFSVFNNELTGTLPKGIKFLTDLEILYVDGNNFTGNIITKICNNHVDNGGNLAQIVTDCNISCGCCEECNSE